VPVERRSDVAVERVRPGDPSVRERGAQTRLKPLDRLRPKLFVVPLEFVDAVRASFGREPPPVGKLKRTKANVDARFFLWNPRDGAFEVALADVTPRSDDVGDDVDFQRREFGHGDRRARSARGEVRTVRESRNSYRARVNHLKPH